MELEEPISLVAPEILDTADIVVLSAAVTAGMGKDYTPVEVKAKELRSREYHGEIMIQGGISDQTIDRASSTGATSFVSGTFIVNNQEGMRNAIIRLKNAFKLGQLQN